MKEGYGVRVITGEHKGKIGKIIGPFIAKGFGTLGDEDLSGRWFVQFDGSGEQDILRREELETIDN